MRRDTMRRLWAIACAGTLSLGGAAHAVDGVIEINNASILAAGGYPFAVPAPGSYVVTSNLTPPAGAGALVVGAAGDVQIDLNGFSLIGSGIGVGIFAAATPGVTVRNGTITGFAGGGIAGGLNLRVSKTRIFDNGGDGIVGGGNCLIVENAIQTNAGFGIAADNCKIENNVIAGNLDDGIMGFNNVIVHNQITANGMLGAGGGILSTSGSTIRENVIVGNLLFGISDAPVPPLPAPFPPFPVAPMPPGPRNNIVGNVIADNVEYGIYMGVSALITDNTVNNNGAEGIVCAISCTVRGNQVETNNTGGGGLGGAIVGPGSTVHHNSISDNAGIGLVIDLTAGYTNNTLNANLPGPDAAAPPLALPPPHPTAGFFNLCSGALGGGPACP